MIAGHVQAYQVLVPNKQQKFLIEKPCEEQECMCHSALELRLILLYITSSCSITHIMAAALGGNLQCERLAGSNKG